MPDHMFFFVLATDLPFVSFVFLMALMTVWLNYSRILATLVEIVKFTQYKADSSELIDQPMVMHGFQAILSLEFLDYLFHFPKRTFVCVP